MSLKLYPRPNGVFYIRGTVQGRRVDESARTRVRAEAEAIRAQLEADLFKRAVYGDKAVATFAEAAEAFLLAGRPGDHLPKLLAEIGLTKLSEIDQTYVDKLAKRLKPNAAPATVIRQIYAPISAVMNHSAPKLCDPVKFIKPKGLKSRIDYLTPREVETLIGFLPPQLAGLVTFYVATGCRATEALDLLWKDVSDEGERVVFWETKGGYPRGVNLQQRGRRALPARADDPNAFVWLNSKGAPWHGYDAINLMLRRYCERHSPEGKPLKAGDPGPRFRPVHCHLFRHTWATWAYAVTKDLNLLMSQGGWKSVSMVMRYAHVGSDDLARAVNAANWEIVGKPSRQRRLRVVA